MHTPGSSTRVRDRTPGVRRTLLVILALNIAVVGVKVLVGVRTGALAVLGAALESGLDALNNLVGMALTAVASRAPDEDHPYGHDKFETLGALAIVGFLSISCFELLREGIEGIVGHHHPASASPTTIALLALTAVAHLAISRYERRRGRELNSTFLVADAAHTAGDLYVTLLAIASLGLSRVGLGAADPVLALVVALLIARNGVQIVREIIPVLVDARAVDAADIRRIVGAIPDVVDVRSVRSRSTSSGQLFAEVSIGVAADTSVSAAHTLADAIEARLGEVLGDAQVTVHVEPA